MPDGARSPPAPPPPPPRASTVHAPGPSNLALLSTSAAASTKLPPRDQATPVFEWPAIMLG
ncbi:hypothetical protein N7461_007527 [Penicillium sp. DV-2018c]|nr:hypothetical protein N7461_007527 [Penicillium sp. DV-2018c]